MKAKKSLGQNFLKSIPALNNIVKAGDIVQNDTILEIGPGKGALTAKLLETGARVIAVEKDDDLLGLLKEKFAKQISSGSLVLVHEDILDFEMEKVVRQDLTTFKIIANIPYNITGAILKKFLTSENQPSCMVLMVQNEVAKRIVASDKKESILSISVKAYGEPKLIMKVPARYFSPAPKVDSAVIQIKNISRKNFGEGKVDEEKFWELVKAGFAHKRKVLSSNLKNEGFILNDLEMGKKRAEDLSLSDWLRLTEYFS